MGAENEVRISRFLASAGVASRRHADLLIEQGRVLVNGRRARLGEKVRPSADKVTVDGREVTAEEPRVYLALNKPPGYLSTCSDPFSRRTVLSLVRGVKERVFPVGRLDQDADGLLLLTNDGELTYLLTHPKHRVIKEYVVEVIGDRDERKVKEMLSGIIIDGRKVSADYAEFLPLKGPRERLRIGVHEGEKHLVKKMCAWAGYGVYRLTRTKVGRVSLGDLPMGKWRHLTPAEVKALYDEAMAGKDGTRGKASPNHDAKRRPENPAQGANPGRGARR